MKYPEVSKRLTQLLNEKKMTAQELSDKSGVGKSSISHYINGSHEPHNRNAGAMAEVLEVNPAYLMGFDVPRDPIVYSSPEKEVIEWMGASFPDLLIDKVRDLMREMNDDGKKKVLDYARDIVENDKYRLEKKGDDALCGSTDPADASAL